MDTRQTRRFCRWKRQKSGLSLQIQTQSQPLLESRGGPEYEGPFVYSFFQLFQHENVSVTFNKYRKLIDNWTETNRKFLKLFSKSAIIAQRNYEKLSSSFTNVPIARIDILESWIDITSKATNQNPALSLITLFLFWFEQTWLNSNLTILFS